MGNSTQQDGDIRRKEQGETGRMNRTEEKNKRKHMSKPLKIVLIAIISILGILIVTGVFLLGTKTGRRILYQYAADQISQALDQDEEVKEVETTSPPVAVRQKDYSSEGIEQVRNYLIFGLEEIEGARNTDTMMLVSLDLKEGKVKITSLMRDTIVDIPEHGEHKLNSAYAYGGLDLMLETIEKNYKIDLDGYASVTFDNFEEVIDLLGGVEIELTEDEAEYLNTTNYISNPEYRNVKPGKNLMNGNQTLGYCRVRKRLTINGGHDDYGRTERHRIVLDAIFKKYKSQNILDLINISYKCLQFVETNVRSDEIASILEALVENHIPAMETFRLPVDDMFSEETLPAPDGDSLVLDWDANLIEFYQFIYKDTEEEAIKRLEKTTEDSQKEEK